MCERVALVFLFFSIAVVRPPYLPRAASSISAVQKIFDYPALTQIICALTARSEQLFGLP